MTVYWKIGKIVKLVKLLELTGCEGISKELIILIPIFQMRIKG